MLPQRTQRRRAEASCGRPCLLCAPYTLRRRQCPPAGAMSRRCSVRPATASAQSAECAQEQSLLPPRSPRCPAACRRAPPGGDRGFRPKEHAALRPDGQIERRAESSSFCLDGAGPVATASSPPLADDHLGRRVRLHSCLRCSPPISRQRPPDIIDLLELPLCVPLRKHLVAAGIDQFALAAAAWPSINPLSVGRAMTVPYLRGSQSVAVEGRFRGEGVAVMSARLEQQS